MDIFQNLMYNTVTVKGTHRQRKEVTNMTITAKYYRRDNGIQINLVVSDINPAKCKAMFNKIAAKHNTSKYTAIEITETNPF